MKAVRYLTIFVVVSFFLLGCGYHKTISKEDRADDSRQGGPTNQGLKDIFGQIQAGNLDAVKEDLESGIDVNLVNPEGQSLLVYAFIWTKKEIIFYLLEQGADPELADLEGKALRDYGKENMELYEQVLAFLEKDEIQRELFEVIVQGNASRVKELLELGADPNLRFPDNGATALIQVVILADRKDRKSYRNFQMIIRHLLQQDNFGIPIYGTQINLRDSSGHTALHYAEEKKDRGLIRALKAAGGAL